MVLNFPSEVEFSTGQYNIRWYGCSSGISRCKELWCAGIKLSLQVVLSYLVLIPAIAYFGGDSLSKVVDETGKALAFNQLVQARPGVMKNLEAGAAAAGGPISLIKHSQ